MVLSYLFTPSQVEHKPFDAFFLGLLFASFGVGVAFFLPELQGSITIFAVIPAIPLMLSLLKREERRDEACETSCFSEALKNEKNLFSRHAKLIEVFSFLFLGAVIAYTFWFVILPPETSASLFESQVNEIEAVRNATSAWFFNSASASNLFLHNLTVLALMFVFCLFYGIGSLYLLLWNASIIGAALGRQTVENGFIGFAQGFLGFLPHGSLEAAAYFVASIAGGIIGLAVMRSKKKPKALKQIAVDAATLAAVSVALLAAAAVVESVA